MPLRRPEDELDDALFLVRLLMVRVSPLKEICSSFQGLCLEWLGVPCCLVASKQSVVCGNLYVSIIFIFYNDMTVSPNDQQ